MNRWLCLLCALLVCGSSAQGDTPKGNFEIHDLSLWILEQSATQANARQGFRSAFPPSMAGGRPDNPALKANHPAPVGLIRFFGQPVDGLDVDLRTKAGVFLAHWPQGELLPNRLRWAGMPDLSLADRVEDGELPFVDSTHWINKARQGEALFVRRGSRAERFLAYDTELNLPAPIKLHGGPDKFTIENTSGATLYDVLISRGTPAGRRVAWIDVLEKGEVKKAGAPAKVVGAPSINLFGPPAKKAVPSAEAVQKAAPAAAPQLPDGVAPDALPAAPPQLPGGATPTPDSPPPSAVVAGGVEIKFSEPLPSGAPETAAATTVALANRLQAAGLRSDEIDLFVDRYAQEIFEGEALVVACRLAPVTIEEKLPLSVFPEPAKTVRVAMVVMRNADPQLGGEVERLIAQLGDAKYKIREQAQARLMELGPLAFPPLNKALSNADPEIVLRVERILLTQNQNPNAKAALNPALGKGRAVPINGFFVPARPVIRVAPPAAK